MIEVRLTFKRQQKDNEVNHIFKLGGERIGGKN